MYCEGDWKSEGGRVFEEDMKAGKRGVRNDEVGEERLKRRKYVEWF
jgi:hypothetical protein